jgi:hypothetical protein
MFKPTIVGTSPSDERRRIWQRYEAGKLDDDAATVQLLRLHIETQARVRALRDNGGEPVRT